MKVGHPCDEPDRRVAVGRVQHGGAVDRAERRQVLQRHLGWAVFADRYARVRTAQPEIGPADRRHADLVVRAGQEGTEGRREGGLAERLHPGLRADHRLLGDVHLEEALGRDRLDVLGVGGVPDLAVEDDEVGAFSGEPRERLAERLARGDRLGVGGRGRAGRRARAQRHPRLGLRRRDRDRTDAPELLDRPLCHLRRQRLAVPAILVGDLGHAVALLGARHDHRRSVVLGGGTVRLVDRHDVMPVDREGVPPERLRASDEDVRVPAVHRRSSLPQPVEVDHAGEVGRPVMRRRLHRLPDGPFRRLRVADQDPHARGALVQPHRERHPEADRRPLPERAGRGLDPRQLGDRRRVALDRRAELPQRQHHPVIDGPDRLQRRVQHRRGVSFREHEPIVGRALRVGQVGPEVVGEQHGDQMRGRERGRGVAGPCLRWSIGCCRSPSCAASSFHRCVRSSMSRSSLPGRRRRRRDYRAGGPDSGSRR